MSILICGSFAYDTIMVFPDSFKNHILPEKVHILNVCFLAPEMRREFGGCAGNIAYNLKLIGEEPVPMGTVGKDFEPYYAWLRQLQINERHVREIAGSFTAQAFITTDQDDNQIIAFHPGAMDEAHQNSVQDAADIRLGIVSPDGKQGMLRHAREFHEHGIPFVFDPGQQLPLFDPAELAMLIDQATYVTVNDYECELLMKNTGKDIPGIAREVEALIVTRGAQGSEIHTRKGSHSIPVVATERQIDPTGCGDAYRAGLLLGIHRGMDWPTTGRIGSLLGSVKIAVHGTQNHQLSAADFSDQFRRTFGYDYQ